MGGSHNMWGNDLLGRGLGSGALELCSYIQYVLSNPTIRLLKT